MQRMSLEEYNKIADDLQFEIKSTMKEIDEIIEPLKELKSALFKKFQYFKKLEVFDLRKNVLNREIFFPVHQDTFKKVFPALAGSSLKIKYLNLPPRILTAFLQGNINELRDLDNKHIYDLHRLHGFGRESLDYVLYALKRLNDDLLEEFNKKDNETLK